MFLNFNYFILRFGLINGNKTKIFGKELFKKLWKNID